MQLHFFCHHFKNMWPSKVFIIFINPIKRSHSESGRGIIWIELNYRKEKKKKKVNTRAEKLTVSCMSPILSDSKYTTIFVLISDYVYWFLFQSLFFKPHCITTQITCVCDKYISESHHLKVYTHIYIKSYLTWSL